jgi:hypothetical protein
MTPGSGRLSLELVELHPRAGYHARQIGRQHHHVEAALHRARRERRAGAVHYAARAFPQYG